MNQGERAVFFQSVHMLCIVLHDNFQQRSKKISDIVTFTQAISINQSIFQPCDLQFAKQSGQTKALSALGCYSMSMGS